jgi:hydroxymethylglutaryl-CoA lyase
VTRRVQVVEVGPRDGLQNESALVPVETKAAFIQALVAAGHTEIEATSFVSPARVPQLADAEILLRRLGRPAGVRLHVLVPNPKGLERALRAGAQAVAVFVAASETFNRRNLGMPVAAALSGIAEVVAEARHQGLPVRGYVSTVVHCPFEGRIPPGPPLRLAARLLELGCEQVSLGETIGKATPNEIRLLLRGAEEENLLPRCALHLHDTYGMAVANVMAGLEAGVRVFDASAGGLGGCPFAPGAAGNLATEDLVHLLDGLGLEHGLQPARLQEAAALIEAALGHPLPGRAYRARARGPSQP